MAGVVGGSSRELAGPPPGARVDRGLEDVEPVLGDVLHHAVSLVNHEVAEVAQIDVGTLADGVGQSAGRGHQDVAQLVHGPAHAAPHQPRL